MRNHVSNVEPTTWDTLEDVGDDEEYKAGKAEEGPFGITVTFCKVGF